MNFRIKGLLAGMVLLLAATLAGSTGAAPSNSLPGGTSISDTITSPANGATLPLGPVTVNGTAAVGQGQAVANTLLLYVVDVSGSTGIQQATNVCLNQSVYDQSPNTTLDCEILAIKDTNAAAISTGTIDKIGAIIFGGDAVVGALDDAKILDLAPPGGIQQMIDPDVNNPNTTPGVPAGTVPATNDLGRVLSTLYTNQASFFGVPPGWGFFPFNQLLNASGATAFTPVGVDGNTNYWAAVEAVKTFLQTTPGAAAIPNKVVVFVSDGVANVGGPFNQPVASALGELNAAGFGSIKFKTFAVGPGGDCTPIGVSFGTLEQIAQFNNPSNHCLEIPNPANAATSVPGVVASNLTSVTVSVDGGPFVAPATINSPGVPHAGPVTVDWSNTYTGLAANQSHTFCTHANGTDGGGAGITPDDCVTIFLKAPPVVTAGPPGQTTPEGSPFTLTGGASDGVPTWSSTGGTGHCTFANEHALVTDVTCDDNGIYTLTLTADDGVNVPPSTSSIPFAVTNVAPNVTAPAPPAPTRLGDPVSITWPFTDAGTNDTFTCVINWGDGITVPAAITGNTCEGTHTYATSGNFNAIATVTDDDGDHGSAGVPALVDGPPVVNVPTTSGNEGAPIMLNGSATDDLSTPIATWTAVETADVDAGATCTFADEHAPVTTITCTDDGHWTLTMTASDGLNPPVSMSKTLTVNNVAPVVGTVTPTKSGLTVNVSAPVTDVSTNDVLTCLIAWGDTSSTPGTMSGGVCTGSHTYTAGTLNATITVTGFDDDGGSNARSVTVNLNRDPSCTGASSSPNTLWPANHKLVAITIGGCTDADGDTLTYVVSSVRQDEALNGTGDGDTSPDATMTTSGALSLRAERSGTGDGRVYTITLLVLDGHGGSSTATVTVGVPHNNGGTAVNTPGVSVNSFGP